jgi:hypothetical protein
VTVGLPWKVEILARCCADSNHGFVLSRNLSVRSAATAACDCRAAISATSLSAKQLGGKTKSAVGVHPSNPF